MDFDMVKPVSKDKTIMPKNSLHFLYNLFVCALIRGSLLRHFRGITVLADAFSAGQRFCCSSALLLLPFRKYVNLEKPLTVHLWSLTLAHTRTPTLTQVGNTHWPNTDTLTQYRCA